jgi:predicted lipoprotein with Yx(FWY)xxD motif
MKAPKKTKTYAAIAALAATVVLVAAACGGSDDSSSASSGSSTSAGSQQVSVRDAGGFDGVLVDRQGNALYASDEEAAKGDVLCTAACLSFWDPLTLPSGASAPSGAPDVDAMLGTTTRPDGAQQVTFEGKPLYRFTEDTSPGNVTGDGFKDSFGGQDFTWHVAMLTGASAPGMTTTTRDQPGY